MKKYGALIAIEIALVGISFAIAMIAMDDMYPWYNTLTRSPLNPPGWVFGPVWTCLYLMIGVAIWRVVTGMIKKGKNPSSLIAFFTFHMALNYIWTPLFFKWHVIEWALIDLGAILITLLGLMVAFFKKDKVAGALLIPYAGWSAFATYLTTYIWLYN